MTKITDSIKNLNEAMVLLDNLNNPEYLEANWIAEDEVEWFKQDILKEIQWYENDLEWVLNYLSRQRQQYWIMSQWYLEESLRIRQLADSYEKKMENIEKSMDFFLNAYNKKEFNTELYKLSYRKSEAVEIYNEEMLPKWFMKEKITIAPDKTAIKEALKNWAEVPGATIKVNQNLQIK